MLARREYSYAELYQKLTLHYADDETVLALDKLKAQTYQSDTRFASEFIQMRFNQGKGKTLIQLQLKQKGVTSFDFSDYDFFALAKVVRKKKFGKVVPKDSKQKAKQMRFLQSRGFDFEQINYAFTDNQ